MITSYNMLQQYVDIKLDPKNLAHKLTMNGFEVEMSHLYPTLLDDFFKVGKIIKKEKHPHADKLWVCAVDIKKEILTIVCGAQNFHINDHVPVATIGATMPNGLLIKETSLKEINSMGMLCSTKELGLYYSKGLWIMPPTALVGDSVNHYLPEEDTIFDIAITPNRGDALGTMGLAREVAIIENQQKIKQKDMNIKSDSSVSFIKVEVNSKDCKRYCGRVMKGIKVGESPTWLKIALKKYNINSINNVVDLSNYIMMETGQPTHIFDLHKIHGNSIQIENLKESSQFTTLMGDEVTLPKTSLVIRDNENILALAGIIGGKDCGVTFDTTDIFIESAHFDSNIIRSIGQLLSIYTDSSYRFSRDTDIHMAPYALDWLSELIMTQSGGAVSPMIDQHPNPKPSHKIIITKDFIEKKLGFQLDTKKLETLFLSLQFHFEKNDHEYTLTIPSYRNDCLIPIDIVEEIIRVYGYENLPLSNPSIHNNIDNGVASLPLVFLIKNMLAQYGLEEIYHFSYSTQDKDKLFQPYPYAPISIENPLNQDFTHMRSNLLSGVFHYMSTQYKRGKKDFSIFEIGNIAYYNEGELTQETHLSIGLSGLRYQPHYSQKETRNADFFDLKGIIELLFQSIGISSNIEFKKTDAIDFLHTHKEGLIFLNQKQIGYIGELHPQLANQYKFKQDLFLLEIDLSSILKDETMIQKSRSFKPISKHPGTIRDFAFMLSKDAESNKMMRSIEEISPLIVKVCVIDLYENLNHKNNEISITFSVTIQSNEKTLVEDEIGTISQQIIDLIQTTYQGTLRDK